MCKILLEPEISMAKNGSELSPRLHTRATHRAKTGYDDLVRKRREEVTQVTDPPLVVKRNNSLSCTKCRKRIALRYWN